MPANQQTCSNSPRARARRTIGHLGLATLVLLGLAGMRPGSAALARVAAAPVTPAATSTAPAGVHALLQPAAPRMGNGTDRLAVRLTLLDGANHPLAGHTVALTVSASYADPGASAVTDPTGTAALQVGIRAAQRHTGLASGLLTLGAVDLTLHQSLAATARIAVYNRVAVMVAGLGTHLSCTLQECHDANFGAISADVLTPLGYNLAGDGVHRTELEYSYRGGTMKPMANGTMQWLPTGYSACDTLQSLPTSEAALRALLKQYRTRYPYTSFELIGHSLGGLVAVEALASDGGAFLRGLGPAAVDKIVTLDSPINGINQHEPLSLLGDLAGGLTYLRPCSAQLFGTYVLAHLATIGSQAPGLQDRWMVTLHRSGVDVMTMTNSDDLVVPEPYAIIDAGRPTATADRARFELAPASFVGHGLLLSPTLVDRAPNPAWPVLVSTVQAYLTQPCMPFAPTGAACPYPTINIGF